MTVIAIILAACHLGIKARRDSQRTAESEAATGLAEPRWRQAIGRD